MVAGWFFVGRGGWNGLLAMLLQAPVVWVWLGLIPRYYNHVLGGLQDFSVSQPWDLALLLAMR